ncbi:MAG: diaminopimelate decarboxylase [Okeania sp. SIO3H1]|uniref:diaminopimelate decarboxylase n=1 Tax=Okeania sp. SIO1I7 TaxID=2607772 RepID=UPI0013CB483B|nr:diaminopimelate decarboxylase [Okeania sp. SIO1I7]NEN92245.1 diaminopimelate decarboxylase [Okeania sp. SIO3H1]NET26966.1 diaminopimelate decarboxylase [Okeania sp. SIO1I7]
MVSTQPVISANSGLQYLPKMESSPNQELLPLTAKVNNLDHLEIGGWDVPALVEKFGSPLYILDEYTLRAACRQYRDALKQYYPGESLVLYASKAWSCLAVCAICGSEGLGIDVVSGGELYTAIQAGINPEKIYLHGNNKSLAELSLAVETDCVIVIDNWLELKTLADLKNEQTEELENPTKIMVRFTPGIECHTHEYIRTGHLDSKFGFDPNQLNDVFSFISQQQKLSFIGIHAHIGSQIFEVQPHQDLATVMVDAMTTAMAHNLSVKEINMGGGLGIRYTEADDPPSIETWVHNISKAMVDACQARQLPLPKLLCEPGRSIISPACVTAYTIGSQKQVPEIRTYISVDGGMSDNPRPITYQSLYRMVVANKLSEPLTETVTVAGKHCESGDVLVKNAMLPVTQPGDCLVVMATGAYNYSMASNYNRLPRPAGVLVNNDEVNVILQRETYQDLLTHDVLPERIAIEQP